MIRTLIRTDAKRASNGDKVVKERFCPALVASPLSQNIGASQLSIRYEAHEIFGLGINSASAELLN
jgi:hypothetical protein